MKYSDFLTKKTIDIENFKFYYNSNRLDFFYIVVKNYGFTISSDGKKILNRWSIDSISRDFLRTSANRTSYFEIKRRISREVIKKINNFHYAS